MAIVGLGFGAEFIPIYQSHPHAEMYAICQRLRKLDQFGDAFGVERRYASYEEALEDPRSTLSTSTRRFPTTPRSRSPR